MDKPEFKVGDRVRHPEFGNGLVLETRGQGEQASVFVSFDDKSKRRLVVRLAKLTLLEPPAAPRRGT